MTFGVYTIKDEINERYMQPNFFRSDIEAIRLFKLQMNDTAIFKDNAADFGLYKIGTFDEEKGFTETNTTKVTGGLAVVTEEK